MYPKLYPASSIFASRSARLVSRTGCLCKLVTKKTSKYKLAKKLASTKAREDLQQLEFLQPEVSVTPWPEALEEKMAGKSQRLRSAVPAVVESGVPNKRGFKSTSGH